MQYTCFNCEEIVEVPDVAMSLGNTQKCPQCATFLNLDIYKKCPGCGNYYISTFKECPECDYLNRSKLSQIEPRYLYVENEFDYITALSYLNDLNIIGLDTELNGLDVFDNDLLLVQLGNEDIVFIFDFDWHEKLKTEPLWKDPEKTFLIQNAKFDLKVLKHKLGIEIANIFDTMLAERILTCGLYRRNRLDQIAEKYLDIKMDKTLWEEIGCLDKENLHKEISSRVKEYSALDVQVLPTIHKRQCWELRKEKLMKIAQLEFEVCKVIAETELNGMYVDVEMWQKAADKCKNTRDQAKQKINKYLREKGITPGIFSSTEFNFNSIQQLKTIFSRLGINLESTEDSELAKLNHPLAELIREYRKSEKLLSAFGVRFLNLVRKDNSRVYPSFHQIGADTGRFSCCNPNLQQIPSSDDYRGCFRAPPGKKIVTCDYSQQELRMLASFTRDPKLIDTYKSGIDFHTATASLMFDIPKEKVEKDYHRYIAKRINFGLMYGRGAASLGAEIGVSTEEAESLIQKYFSQFGHVRDWLDKAAKFACTKGYTRTLLGRKRYYKLPPKKDREYNKEIQSIARQGKNTPLQGGAVDMMKLALVSINRKLKEKKIEAPIINIVHDEISVECDENDAKRVLKIIKKCMEEAGEKIVKHVPVVAEGCVSDFWTH